jgi:hypothetical protein
MDVKRQTRKIRLDSMHTAIKYQLITELVFLRKMPLLDNDVTYLAYLAQWGPIPLKDFCSKVVINIFGEDIATDVDRHPVRVQTVRNRLGALEKKGLVIKEGKGKKVIRISPSIPMVTKGSVLLEYNFLYIETQTDKRPVAEVSQGVGTI